MTTTTLDTETASRISVRLAEPSDAPLWKRFLAESVNGTLFHDLDFLAYHPVGRFRIHNLIFSADDRVLALLPASIISDGAGRPVLRSPYGASFGGFVVGRRLPLRHALALVACLQEHARACDFASVELVLGPSVYADPHQDLPGFALAASGFRLAQRWVNPMIPLSHDPDQALARVSSKRRSAIRGAIRDGVEVNEAAADQLARFHEVLVENRARHGATPTHTLEELYRIFELVPDRVRLFLCTRAGELLGGSVVFELNAQAVYSIQPAHRDRFKQHQPAAVLLHRLVQHYGSRRFPYLDLGPTGSYHAGRAELTINAGNAFFKEEMGGLAFNRDSWVWETV